MAAQTNYEDNLYHLGMSLRQLRNSIGLDIDPDLFLQKLVADILFHDKVLSKLHASLEKNPFLIRRPEILRLILQAKREFASFIDTIDSIDSLFAKELLPFLPQLLQCRDRNEAEADDIEGEIQGPDADSGENGDIIGQDEYRFLFQHESESDII